MTARNCALSSTYSAATNRKSSTRNSTLCTVSFVRDDQHGEAEDERRERVERDRLDH